MQKNLPMCIMVCFGGVKERFSELREREQCRSKERLLYYSSIPNCKEGHLNSWPFSQALLPSQFSSGRV